VGCHRRERVQDELQRIVGQIIASESRDPRLAMVSVTRVALSNDLSVARVYVSCLGSEQSGEKAAAVLEGAQGFIRSLVAGRMRIRRVPKLEFRYDPSMSEAARIHQLLEGCGRSSDS
jgi:ribosome-binding factor A